jgi:hypothetical protein
LKIESQNRKVHAAHDALVAKQKKVQDLSVLHSSSPGTSTNALMKAVTALEKSTVAFERVVDGAIPMLLILVVLKVLIMNNLSVY